MTESRAAPDDNFDLKGLGLIDGPHDEVLQRIAGLAAATLFLDTALIVLLDQRDNSLRVAASHGMPAMTGLVEGLPAEYAFDPVLAVCNGVLALSDLRRSVPPSRVPLIDEIGVRGLLAAPILCPAELPVGALAGISGTIRIWSRHERQLIGDLAHLATQRILLRASLRTISILSR